MKIELKNGNTIDISNRLIGFEYMTSLDGTREYYYATFLDGSNAIRYSVSKSSFANLVKGVAGGKNKENAKAKN